MDILYHIHIEIHLYGNYMDISVKYLNKAKDYATRKARRRESKKEEGTVYIATKETMAEMM